MAVIGSLGEFGLSELFQLIGDRTGLLRLHNGGSPPVEAELSNGFLCGVRKGDATMEELSVIFNQLKEAAHGDSTFEFLEDKTRSIEGRLKLPLSQLSDNFRFTVMTPPATSVAPIAAPIPEPISAPVPVTPIEVPAPVAAAPIPAPASIAPPPPSPAPEPLPEPIPVVTAPLPPMVEVAPMPPLTASQAIPAFNASQPIPSPRPMPPPIPEQPAPVSNPPTTLTPATGTSIGSPPTAVTGLRKKTTRLLPPYNPEWANHIFILASEPKTWLEQDLQKFYDEARPKLLRSVSLKDLSLHLLVDEVVVYAKLQKLVTLGLVKEATKVEEVAGLTRPIPKLMRHTQRVQLPPGSPPPAA